METIRIRIKVAGQPILGQPVPLIFSSFHLGPELHSSASRTRSKSGPRRYSSIAITSPWLCPVMCTELVFLNVYGAQESIPRNEFHQPMCSLAGRYDNHIPTRFLAPIDCLKIPAL
jgi:hypothetical protein